MAVTKGEKKTPVSMCSLKIGAKGQSTENYIELAARRNNSLLHTASMKSSLYIT